MATQLKKPEEFEVGDVIKDVTTTPYSGSAMIRVTDMGDGRTEVGFANGEIVQFYNGVLHIMKE
jgi:hypothetical protein